MGSNGSGAHPAAIRDARRQFERWRRTRTSARAPIPDRLWAVAATLAETHGVNPIARALRVNYYALKRRLRSLSPATKRPCPAQAEESRPAFMELEVASFGRLPECTVEIVSPRGTCMRIFLRGSIAPIDVAAVTRSFFGGDL